jgi:hypothetical protein
MRANKSRAACNQKLHNRTKSFTRFARERRSGY